MSKYLRFSYPKEVNTAGPAEYLGDQRLTTNYLVVSHHRIWPCVHISMGYRRGENIVSLGCMPVFFVQGAVLAYQSVIVKRLSLYL